MYLAYLKITNNMGESITFNDDFKLHKEVDLSALKADVVYAESAEDGSNYQRTMLNVRDFDIPFYIDKTSDKELWYEERRRKLFRVFNPKHNPFRVDFATKAGFEYYIVANIDSVPALTTGFDDNNEGWQTGVLQLTAYDPYIYHKQITTVKVASWIGAFKFPLIIKEQGIQMGHRLKSLIANVNNAGSSETGMVIRFKAISSLKNPSLINVNTYEKMKLNIDMEGGDEIEISTYKGKKSITLIRNNVKSNIFNTFDFLTSQFLQLQPGDNLLRYDADAGIDSLEVKITFTARFTGV